MQSNVITAVLKHVWPLYPTEDKLKAYALTHPMCV